MIDSDIVVAHFTSQLAGGAGIAAQTSPSRVVSGRSEERAAFWRGEALDSTMVPAFQEWYLFLEKCCCAGQQLARPPSSQRWICYQPALGS